MRVPVWFLACTYTTNWLLRDTTFLQSNGGGPTLIQLALLLADNNNNQYCVQAFITSTSTNGFYEKYLSTI